MTEEVSTSFHISFTVWATAALVGTLAVVLTCSLLAYNNYTNKYSDAMIAASKSHLLDVVHEPYVSAPQAYSSISEAVNEISTVTYDGSLIYDISTNLDNSIVLLNGNTSIKNVEVKVVQSDTKLGLLDVTITTIP